MSFLRTAPQSRIVVVDEGGRVYDRRGVKIETNVQDNGQTIKVFINRVDPEQANTNKRQTDICQ